MAKKDNRPVQATEEMRRASHQIRYGRANEKSWKNFVEKQKGVLRALTGDEVDITLLTPTGEEVASITESEPSETYDYAAYFAANPAAAADLKANYRKPPTTKVTVSTQWVEDSMVPRK